MKLSVIMPIHSERETISEIVGELKRLIDPDILLEIILIVAEKSPQDTLDICRKLVEENPNVRMYIQKNPGFGMAYREAFGYASGDYVLMLDSDGEFELQTIPKMVDAAKSEQYDLIQASRWIKGGGAEGYPPLTYLMNRLFQYIFRLFLWTRVHDLTFGYKMLRKSVINQIEWEGKRHELAMETTIKPIQKGYRAIEIPSFWRKRRDGQSKNPGWMRIKLYTPLAIRVAFKKIFNANMWSFFKKNLFPVIIISAAALIFGIFIKNIWPFTIDDAFIIFRYAKNLTNTGSIEWNVGEGPVEGSTSFLWLLISVVPHFLRIDAVVFMKIFGLLATLGMFYFSFFLVKIFYPERYCHGNMAGSVAILFLVAFPPTSIHAVSGLETPLFTCLSAALVFSLFNLTKKPSAEKAKISSILALLLGLTRPDGNLIAILGLGTAIFLSSELRKKEILKSLLWIYFLGGLIYFLWRWKYFGFLLPLPFYVKMSDGNILAGASVIIEFIKFFVLRAGIPLIIGAAFLRRKHLIAIVPISVFFIFYMFPAHIMGQNFRFLMPVSFFLLILAAVGTTVLYDVMEKKKIFFSGVLLTLSISLAWFAVGNFKIKMTDAAGLKNAHIRLGKILHEVDGTGTKTISLVDAGALSYYSGWRVIDTVGLNSAHIARGGARDYEYLLKNKVDLFVLVSKNETSFVPVAWWEEEYYERLLASGAEPLLILKYDDGCHLWVMGNKDSVLGKKLAEISEKYLHR